MYKSIFIEIFYIFKAFKICIFFEALFLDNTVFKLIFFKYILKFFNCYISTSDPSIRTRLAGKHKYLYTFIDQAGYTEAIYSKVSYGRWMFLANKGFDFEVKSAHMNSISDQIFVDCKDTNHDTNVSRSKRVYLNITKKDDGLLVVQVRQGVFLVLNRK